MALTKTLSRRVRDGETGHKRKVVTKLQISAPVELISTTNMISYTAPTLRSSPSSASSSSPVSGKFSPLSASSSVSDMESSSPPTSPKVQPNHLSAYFATAPVPPPMSPARTRSTRSIASASSSLTSPSNSAPQRSVSSSSTSPSRHHRKSGGGPPRTSHRGRMSNPFGVELAKVSEIAEEYGINVNDAEDEYMISHGLHKFCAEDYLKEIGGIYDDEFPRLTPGWI